MTTFAESFSRAASFRLAGDLSEAVEHYRNALSLAPASAETWNLLGSALESLGQFEEATSCFRRALSIKPDLADAYRNLALSRQLAPDGSELTAITALAERSDMPIEERSAAAFALGRAFDDAGRFDEAFAAYERANSMYRAARAAAGDWFDVVALGRQIDDTIATFTAEFFASVGGWGVQSEVPVFVVGMPRSGTSLVEQIAASHSRVFGAGELLDIGRISGELGRAIGGGLNQLRWQRHSIQQKAQAYHERLHEIGGPAERVIDKMPDNVLDLGLIATLFPMARVVFCRRDPRDTALSCFFQKFSSGAQTFSYDLIDCGRRHLQIDRLITHWRRVLPLGMIEIEYERLVADLPAEADRLVSFLGLEWEPACLEFHRTGRTVTTASSWQVRQPLYDRSIGRWRNYEKHIAPLLDVLLGADALGESDSVGAEPGARTLRERVTVELATAAEHYTAGNIDHAEALYRDILRQVPHHPEALLWLGVIAGVRGRHGEAVDLFSQSIASNPHHPGVHFNLGVALRALDRLGEAEAALRNGLILQTNFAPGLQTLGQLLLATGRDNEALECLRKVVEIEPAGAAGHFDLASCLRRLGDMQGSLESLRQAVTLAPEFQSGWNDLGVTYTMLRNWVEAERCFRRVLVLDPGSSRASQQLEYVRQQRMGATLR